MTSLEIGIIITRVRDIVLTLHPAESNKRAGWPR